MKEKFIMKKNDVIDLIETLRQTYPDAKCSLDFETPFELLIAVILSAQCTDDRVNKTTPALFARCSTPQEFVDIPLSELEELIHPCGFYKTKSKNIKLTAQKILNEFDGKVPENMKDLMSLPGVGRKTANVVMLEAFNKPQGIAVDTHCKRLSNRIGLSTQNEPEKIEQDLLKQIPDVYYKDVNHIFIWHGRNTCTARSPKCEECSIQKFCKNFSSKK